MWLVWGEESCVQVFGGETCGKEPLVRPRHRWEVKNNSGFPGSGVRCINWIDLDQDRDIWRNIVYAVMNLTSFTKCGE
jgi:hypothetical protein